MHHSVNGCIHIMEGFYDCLRGDCFVLSLLSEGKVSTAADGATILYK